MVDESPDQQIAQIFQGNSINQILKKLVDFFRIFSELFYIIEKKI
jgi:hypothetical protein